MTKQPRRADRKRASEGGGTAVASDKPRTTAAVPPKVAKRGRATDPAVRALARTHADAAVAALAAVMTDADATPAARVSAASALLSWGYGKSGPGAAGDKPDQRKLEQVVRLVWGGEPKS
jgi:hypothetical protein